MKRQCVGGELSIEVSCEREGGWNSLAPIRPRSGIEWRHFELRYGEESSLTNSDLDLAIDIHYNPRSDHVKRVI